jgi:hypothetical protein
MTDDSGFFERYFKTRPPAKLEAISSDLWNSSVPTDDYSPERDKYQAAILEQYKVYVEMADRISARRALANTFFVTLHAAAFTVVGVFWKDRPTGPRWLLIFPLLVLLGLCLAWFWLVRSYRQLNAGKYAVIGALERRLPASPYWSAEWTALGKGEDKARYWPLTHLEQWVPLLFAVVYVFGFIAVLVT